MGKIAIQFKEHFAIKFYGKDCNTVLWNTLQYSFMGKIAIQFYGTLCNKVLGKQCNTVLIDILR